MTRFYHRDPETGKIVESPIKCQCGLWFATEKDFQEHLDKHKMSFLTTKRIPKRVNIDFYKHGKSSPRTKTKGV